MITLLRKIRKRLISKNNFSSYLLYAIGEIALVVIGILIALQINNYNQRLKNDRAESAALIELKKEFVQNAQLFEDHMAVKNRRWQSWEHHINAIVKEKWEKLEGLRLAGGTRTFVPSQNALNKLVFTGNIDQLKNDSLKSLLASWNTILASYNDYESLHREFWYHEFHPYERSLVAQAQIPLHPEIIGESYVESPFYTRQEQQAMYRKAFKDLEYQNLLVGNHRLLGSTIRAGENLTRTFERIIELLDGEINARKN